MALLLIIWEVTTFTTGVLLPIVLYEEYNMFWMIVTLAWDQHYHGSAKSREAVGLLVATSAICNCNSSTDNAVDLSSPQREQGEYLKSFSRVSAACLHDGGFQGWNALSLTR